ncbi:uncharacterized protein SCHCODRAFT_02321153 [Schizophyllum commune H4-8]|uniref:uncharacterized protein n=1 Tax=Schizophyllum commune (strain H4-8 / FGSC 9210) TaxID=578458 RepID=UPI00216009A2|nr:uncharacterized protein SCHCODRAFT_02321153 [Schizophyllum commune H4-8]KAI5891492.1 hypothetical protein SCHCODRAFT_02321153 [Schizophyllum commune H4-8]
MIGEQVEPVMNVPIRQADEGRVWSDLVSTTPQLSSPTHDVQVDNAPDGPVITAIVKESNDFLGEGPVDEPVERSEDVLASKNEILQAGIFTDALDEQAISAPDQQDFDAPTARDTMSPAKQVLSDHAVDIAARETPAHAVHIADSPGRRTADATAVEERVRKKSAAALIDRAIDVLEERSADAPVPRAEGRRLLDIDTPPATQDAPRERIHYKQKVDAFEIRATEVVHEEQVPGVSDRQNIDATATKVEGLPADHAVDDTFDVAGILLLLPPPDLVY